METYVVATNIRTPQMSVWQSRLARLAVILKHNNLVVDEEEIADAFEYLASIPVEETELTTYLAAHSTFPLRKYTDPTETWDAYLRLRIILADILANCVYSDTDLQEILAMYDEPPTKTDPYIAQLIAAGVVYKTGSVDSFTTLVRNKGKLAAEEARMMHWAAKMVALPRYTEFPYTADGRYITTYLPEGWTYKYVDGSNVYSPPST